MPIKPQDHKSKPRTNAEMIENLMWNVQQIYSVFGDIDRRLTAISRAKMDPETLAKFILDGEKNKDFMEKLNQAIGVEMKRSEIERNQKIAESVLPKENQKTPE